MSERRDSSAVSGQLDVGKTFDGKRVLLIGCTGFVGKVTLSMLLCRYPNIGKVYLLVRPGMGQSAEDRFFTKVATSPAFDPLRERFAGGFDQFLRDKVVPLAGDIGRPLCNFSPEDMAELAGLDAIINSAGLVSFTPSLESALRINAIGPKHCLEVARQTGAALIHVSTCYVAGKRNGEVWEDEPVVGYFPRKDELLDDDFDAEAEIADCQRIIEQTRERAADRAHISEFRDRAAQSLERQRRDPDDVAALRLAVARERKMWVTEQLTELGMERAEHWGWTNTYTYTKSLGEQAILADKEVRATVVRPAIVESSVKFPFPGWNEGFNTTAPLVYLVLKGHRSVMAGDGTPLDIIPVDFIAAGILAATAAVLDGSADPVYQLGSSHENPVTTARLAELTGLVVRREHRRRADAGDRPIQHRIRARLEAMPVSAERFDRFSAPQIKRLADRARDEIDRRLPSWGAPRLTALAERAKEELSKVSDFTGQVVDLVELFRPFTHDFHITFRTDNIQRLHQRLTPADREFLSWAPASVNWRDYWMETHYDGLQKWVFPVLDDELAKKPRSVYTYKDLLELFDAATKLNRHRVAMRLLPTDEDSEAQVYTYAQIQDMAAQAAAQLRERGIGGDSRVLLCSENRPEWGISYFGILKAGACAVPVDAQLSLAEIKNLLRSSRAEVMIASAEVMARLAKEVASPGADVADLKGQISTASAVAMVGADFSAAGSDVALCTFDDILAEPKLSAAAIAPVRRGDKVASLIYTSGTTGTPKGVMLTHKNLTAMAAKLSSLFSLYRHDGLLSVLPLHHTFEFSAGLLMPLCHGAQITYLEEVSPEALAHALESRTITGIVGVPALWQALHRKVTQTVRSRGPLVERAFDVLVDANRILREKNPYGWHAGKLLFYPVHRRFGGRLRLLISGGSALSADVMKSFWGLGFRLYEGYGMTEAAPVITVQRPGKFPAFGSIGRALPGIDVKIHEPDGSGVGEIIARGPNVMKGYADNPEATAEVLKNGWLHTGDLGREGDDGNFYIVGRKKDMILGAAGENVYPDELEEVYGDTPDIKELSVVGLPVGDGTETVAAMVVPDFENGDGTRDEITRRIRDHIKTVSTTLPHAKRIQVLHLWDHELPRTSTRKIKRPEVAAELERLQRAVTGAAGTADNATGSRAQEILAKVCQRPRREVRGDVSLAALGFDSLMFAELTVALEAGGFAIDDASALTAAETVRDIERLLAGWGKRGAAAKSDRKPVSASDDIRVPQPVIRLGRRALRGAQRLLYERLLEARVTGEVYVPPAGGFIVAANHASHLDMGLVKHALGDRGPYLTALAAKDYFFDDPVRRAYFENFTNLVPMERHGSLRESLRTANHVLRDGKILLIFPEGTRSDTGIMIDFKPSLGYLALHNHCGILPIYLAGTHDALPKGSAWPKGREVSAHIGPLVTYDEARKLAEGRSRSDGYRAIATEVERRVRSQAPAESVAALGPSGRMAVADFLAQKEAHAP